MLFLFLKQFFFIFYHILNLLFHAFLFVQLYVENAWTQRHLIQANRDVGTELKDKYVWLVICMNDYSI